MWSEMLGRTSRVWTVFSKLAFFLLFIFSTGAICNTYNQIDLDQKVRQSDLVLIGKVISTYQKGCMQLNSCAKIEVINVLKGNDSGEVVVLFDGEIAERDPLCCEVGKNYLFFIKRIGSYYRSVNGPFGIYELP